MGYISGFGESQKLKNKEEKKKIQRMDSYSKGRTAIQHGHVLMYDQCLPKAKQASTCQVRTSQETVYFLPTESILTLKEVLYSNSKSNSKSSFPGTGKANPAPP